MDDIREIVDVGIDNSSEAVAAGGDDAIEHAIGELAETLEAEQTAQPADRAEAQSKPAVWRSWPAAAALLLVAAALMVASLAGWGPYRRSPEQLTPSEQERICDMEMLAVVGYIEDYRAEHSRLPATVDQLGLDVGDAVIDYELLDEKDFIVMVTDEGVSRSFDSRRAAVDPAPATR